MFHTLEFVHPYGPLQRLPSDSTHQVFFGMVQNDKVSHVVVKACSGSELLREVLCNRLANSLEVPVPKPFIVDTRGGEWQIAEDYAFATALQGHYKVQPRILSDGRTSRESLMAWPHLNAAILFDEWVANLDRHSRNILLGGRNKLLLIDHENSLPREYSPYAPTINFFASHLASQHSGGLTSPSNLAQVVLSAAEPFLKFDLDELEISSLPGDWTPREELDFCLDFLRSRQACLPELILGQFEAPGTTLLA